jgi:hypothetical protein
LIYGFGKWTKTGYPEVLNLTQSRIFSKSNAAPIQGIDPS